MTSHQIYLVAQGYAEGSFSESEGICGHRQASWDTLLFEFLIKFLKRKLGMRLTRELRWPWLVIPT